MSLVVGFGVVALTAVAWNVVTTIMIVQWLQKRGHKINFVLIKALAPVYVHHYKRMTLEDTGKVGSLFYHWVISINAALGSGIIAVVMIFLQRGA